MDAEGNTTPEDWVSFYGLVSFNSHFYLLTDRGIYVSPDDKKDYEKATEDEITAVMEYLLENDHELYEKWMSTKELIGWHGNNIKSQKYLITN